MAALRDVAVILLVVEAMVLLLVPAAVIGASWYGARWLRRKLPPIFTQVRQYAMLAQVYVQRAGAAVIAPLIAAYALAARLCACLNFLIGLVQEEN